MNIEKIKDKLKNNLPYLVVALVIFVIVIATGVVAIDTLHHTVNDNGIRTEVANVTNKYYGNGDFADYYLIETQDNKTYSIINHDDNYGKRMFENIKVGHRYEFTLRDPGAVDVERHTHILKVENDTVHNP